MMVRIWRTPDSGRSFGMVDVVEDDGNEISQFSAFNQFLRPHHRGLVNVVVHLGATWTPFGGRRP